VAIEAYRKIHKDITMIIEVDDDGKKSRIIVMKKIVRVKEIGCNESNGSKGERQNDVVL
jgi:hypothetical protein